MGGRWVGKSLAAIGLMHCGLGVAGYWATWQAIATDGLWNSVTGHTAREAHFWFLAFGVVVVLLGVAIRHMEREGWPLPRAFGWALILFTLPAVILMPVSGWWALLIPATGAVMYETSRGLEEALSANLNYRASNAPKSGASRSGSQIGLSRRV